MIFYLILFLNELYPVVNNLLNLEYISAINRTLIVLSLIFVSGAFFINVKEKKKVSLKLKIILSVSVVFILLILLSILIHGNLDSFAQTKYLTFIMKSIPMILLAYILVTKSEDWHLGKLRIINCIISLSLLKLLIINSSIFWGQELKFGGVNYNELSYIAAINIAISFILLNNFFSKRSYNKGYLALYLTSLVISYTTVFFSGGRGAIVLSIVLFLLFVLNIFKQIKFTTQKIWGLGLIFSLLFLSMIIIIYSNQSLLDGLKRGFNFLNFDGSGLINWENTSGRLNIYLDSLDLISQQLIIGYGIGAVFLIHPSAHFSHNIFLDILIDGGLVFLIASTIFFMYIFIKAIRNLSNFHYFFSFNLFLCTFVNLLSGSNYLIEPLLWFSSTYIILLNKRIENTSREVGV